MSVSYQHLICAIDSGTGNEAGNAAVTGLLEPVLSELGARTERVTEPGLGTHLVARVRPEQPRGKVLPVSYTHLDVYKRQVYGLPIATYMKEYRVRRAMELLRESGGSIAAIAAAVGYESQGKFTRAFKDVTGQLPTEYRREHRG